MKRLVGKIENAATLVACFGAVAWLVGVFVVGMAGTRLKGRR